MLLVHEDLRVLLLKGTFLELESALTRHALDRYVEAFGCLLVQLLEGCLRRLQERHQSLLLSVAMIHGLRLLARRDGHLGGHLQVDRRALSGQIVQVRCE